MSRYEQSTEDGQGRLRHHAAVKAAMPEQVRGSKGANVNQYDTEIRQEALKQAVESCGTSDSPSRIVERAQAFYEFLTGDSESRANP